MKKGLLSILAGALLVVGCQNYDDQFSSLESQINALASTVAGLSQVQSDLAALSGTVSSIQSALASIPSSSEINTAINQGLAGVIADIAALESALDNVVSADDLAAVSNAISDVAGDVNDILASNNVYSQELIITNQAELDIATGLGGKVALINNDVTITLSDDMSLSQLDSVTSKMTAVVGSFKYSADSKDFEGVKGNFPKLKSVSKAFQYATRADISLPALASVGSLILTSGDSELVTAIDLSGLEKLPFVKTGSTVDAISFSDAQSLKLGKLVRYTGAATASQMKTVGGSESLRAATNALTITLKDDDATTIDLASLTTESKDDEDVDVSLALTIAGPRTVVIPNYAKGALIANDATTVTLPDYQWNSGASFNNVVTLAAHKVANDMTLTLANYPDLKSLDVRNDLYKTKNPTGYDIDLTGNTKIETLNVNGYFEKVTASGNTSLKTITTAGEVGTFILINSDVSDLTIGHAAWRTSAGYPTATFEVKDNTKLTSITADSLDDVTQLSIVNNDKLATVSMAKLSAPATKATASTTAGTPGVTPKVGALIYGNAKLTATHQVASAAGAITAVAKKVTLDQIPASVITWLKAAYAVWGTTGYGTKGQASKADGTFYVEVDNHTEVAADGKETEKTSLVIANLYGAATSNGADGTYAKRTFNLGSTDGIVNSTIGGVSTTAVAVQGTLNITLAKYLEDNAALFTEKGITASTSVTGGANGKITFGTGSLTAGDLVFVSVGSVKVVQGNGSSSVTPTYGFLVPTGHVAGTTSDTTFADIIEDKILAGEGGGATVPTAYSGTATSTVGKRVQAIKVTNTSNKDVVFQENGNGNSLDGAAITVTVKRKPAATSSASWTALALWKKEATAVTVTATLANLGISINGTASTADDVMQSPDVLLTLTSDKIGTLTTIGQPLEADWNDITLFKIGSTTITTWLTKEVHYNATQADLKAALGLGADAATPATAAAIKAAREALNIDPVILQSTLSAFGQDGVTNTAAVAGTTPDLITYLAGI